MTVCGGASAASWEMIEDGGWKYMGLIREDVMARIQE